MSHKEPLDINIDGFLKEPKKRANGSSYLGRFTCYDVQWTITGEDVLATFTITAEELADAAESRLLWTDQDVQRGIKPGLDGPADRELSLSDGYPDSKKYVFNPENADDIAEKLLRGGRLFLNPLVWNLRPGKFEAYWDPAESEIFIYQGRIYLPDSHHRHQAIAKAVRTYKESPTSYPKFDLARQFKIELYFLTKEDEGNYFFDKNQRPRPTSKSKSYDLTTQDDLSLLAKEMISRSESLRGNVNRVTDRLTASNPDVVTLSTVRQMMKQFAPFEELDETEIDGLAEVAATFYDMLADVRTELGKLSRAERKQVRAESLVDSAVMMYGYTYLMSEFYNDISTLGLRAASESWRERLGRLGLDNFTVSKWRGDLFSRSNPLWRELGVLKPNRSGTRLTLSNTGATRSTVGRALKQIAKLEGDYSDLSFLID